MLETIRTSRYYWFDVLTEIIGIFIALCSAIPIGIGYLLYLLLNASNF